MRRGNQVSALSASSLPAPHPVLTSVYTCHAGGAECWLGTYGFGMAGMPTLCSQETGINCESERRAGAKPAATLAGEIRRPPHAAYLLP